MEQDESGLILPLNAMRDEAVTAPPNSSLVKPLNRELQEMDPYLEVVWVGERMPEKVIPGLVPGRWHVRRSAPGVVDSYWPITGPDGEYRDLEMALVEKMKAADLWREGALQELKDRQMKIAGEKAREANLRREQAHDLVKENFRAANRVFGEGGMLANKGRFRG